jgi:hypothetical protein
MPKVLERSQTSRAQQRPQTSRFGQPESLAALRPSQRRAAVKRAARVRHRQIEYWLRRLPRP